MSKMNNILIQSSDLFCPLAGVAMESLFENNSDIDDLTVYLISDNISDENLRKIDILSKKFNKKIVVIDGNAISKMLKEYDVPQWRNSYATYYNIFASKVIDDDIDRLLYLDADIIVTGSIKELFNFNMHDNTLAMAIDIASENHKKNIGCRGENYYNAGVILFNFKKWKSGNYSDQIIDHIKNAHADYPIANQDIMNVLMSDEIETLDLKYNFCTDYLIYRDCEIVKKMNGLEHFYTAEDFDNAIKDHIICHYFGLLTSKPWCKNSKQPMVKEWDKYLAQSPWNDFEKINDNRSFAVKCQSMLYYILPKKVFCFINRNITAFLQNKRAKKRNLID